MKLFAKPGHEVALRNGQRITAAGADVPNTHEVRAHMRAGRLLPTGASKRKPHADAQPRVPLGRSLWRPAKAASVEATASEVSS